MKYHKLNNADSLKIQYLVLDAIAFTGNFEISRLDPEHALTYRSTVATTSYIPLTVRVLP